MIGDHFVKDTIDAFYKLRSKAKCVADASYLFQMFNVKSYWPGLTAKGISRFINPLVDAFNEKGNHHLPKHILILPDMDLLKSIKTKINFGAARIIGAVIRYLMKQIDLLINQHLDDLADKKPGALPSQPPQIIWVRMPKIPQMPNANGLVPTELFSLRGKFNSILKEHLSADSHGDHFIMSIEVDLNEFDTFGNLTSFGQSMFWHEIDKAMKKFDCNQITLKPRKSQVIQVVPNAAH